MSCGPGDGSGDLPLHIASKHAHSAAVYRALLAAYPGAARVKNGVGNLPIHYVVAQGTAVVLAGGPSEAPLATTAGLRLTPDATHCLYAGAYAQKAAEVLGGPTPLEMEGRLV